MRQWAWLTALIFLTDVGLGVAARALLAASEPKESRD